MYRLAVPMQRLHEKREPHPRRRSVDGERAVEVYFTVLTIVILGMIVGISAYTVRSIIPKLKELQSPEWQSSHYQRNHESPTDCALKSHSASTMTRDRRSSCLPNILR